VRLLTFQERKAFKDVNESSKRVVLEIFLNQK